MCGITGILSQKGVDSAVLDSMTAQLVHRGPNSYGSWLDQAAGIGFGHRRLSIIDLSEAGHQPMESVCGRFVITYNGEIYNHYELRAELEAARTVNWRGHSDTETLLMCISAWGLRKALEKAVGMFAIALWDRSERVLTLVRDRLGEKPLYYGWAAGAFLFGSELKALTAFPGFDNPVSRRALDCLMRWSYVAGPLSIYRDIYKLPPGALLTISAEQSVSPPVGYDGLSSDNARLTVQRYWSLANVVREADDAPISTMSEAVDGLEQRLLQSISGQSIADVPVGTFLSGGIDSSTIAALQQKHSASKVQTFTIGFHEAAFDESGYARDVADHLGTTHHEMFVSAQDALDLVPELPRMYDEPFADSSQIPTHLLSKAAKSKVAVALSGDGADELFGGYPRYLTLDRHHKLFRKVPRPLGRAGAQWMRRLGDDWIERMGVLGPRASCGLAVKARKLAEVLSEGQSLSKLYSMRTSQWEASSEIVIGADGRNGSVDLPQVEGLGVASHLMLWDALTYLPDDILCKVDRAAMYTSLETRAPFLDHRVVEFAARIPPEMKVSPQGSKWVLRQLLYRYVPSSLIDRPKAGFSVPLAEWLRGPLRNWAEALLDEATAKRQDMFEESLLRSRWQALLRGDYDYSAALWPVFMFLAWDQEQAQGRKA